MVIVIDKFMWSIVYKFMWLIQVNKFKVDLLHVHVSGEDVNTSTQVTANIVMSFGV